MNIQMMDILLFFGFFAVVLSVSIYKRPEQLKKEIFNEESYRDYKAVIVTASKKKQSNGWHHLDFEGIQKNGDSWIVKNNSGITYKFGTSDSSRCTNSLGTFSWHIDRVEDLNGNYMTYTYTKDYGQIYPSEILYNGHAPTGFSPTHYVYFGMEARDDETFSYRSGTCITTRKRLSTIEVRVSGNLVRKYNLSYNYSVSTSRSMLTSVTEIGADGVVINPYMGDDVFEPFLQDPKKVAPFSVSAEKYGVFLRKLFDLWFFRGNPFFFIQFV